MDQIDSQYPLYLIDSHSNYDFTIYEIEMPVENKDQTPIDTHQTVNEQRDNESQKQPKRDRVDNNIFKTPLSEFRKVMKHFFVEKKMRCDAFAQINKEKRNFSTFPKYWVLCVQIGYKDELAQIFRTKMSDYLQKKKVNMGQKRYKQLERVYERMLISLECTKIEEAIKEYWGRFRQKRKFAQSYEQTVRFSKNLETIN